VYNQARRPNRAPNPIGNPASPARFIISVIRDRNKSLFQNPAGFEKPHQTTKQDREGRELPYPGAFKKQRPEVS
jgi:hypothetical protein